MAQQTDQPAGSAAPTREDEQIEPLKFTLSIISPSVSVPNPLSFPQLLATTTVKELKAKIRDVLPSKPADDHQRLIHRGRLLGREMETMEDIFGKDTLANPESQTLHLVLRQIVPDIPAPPQSTPHLGPPHRVLTPLPPQLQPPPRPQSTPAQPNNGLPNQHHLPGIQHIQQHQLLHQADHLQNMMTHRLHQLHQETLRLQQEMVNIEQRSRALVAGAGGVINNNIAQNPFPSPFLAHRLATGPQPTVQHLIAQQQLNRATDGRQGVQDTPFTPPNMQRPIPGTFRPEHTTTTTREGVGPNGERWQITVNETTTTIPIGQHPNHLHNHPQFANNPAMETLQSVIRNADRVLASQGLANNAGGTTAANSAAANENGAVGPHGQLQNVPSDSSAGIATPATGTSSPILPVFMTQPPNGNPTEAVASLNTPPSNVEPVVYLLSSPQGPRALLLSNAETFYSPRQPRRRRHDSPTATQGRAQDHLNQARLGVPRLRRDARGNQPAQNEDNIAAPRAHGNPAAGALGAQIGPIIWLIVRLAGFVWFFTAGNHSWWRFVTVTTLAIVVFIINTGVFNGLAEQLWGPVRRHVEALIPLAGPEAARIPAANAAIPQQQGPAAPADNQPAPRRRRGELDEHEVAARLMEQRRQADVGWLRTQFRRAEHAALLFLASLVPGVGERHIAAREAEAAAAEAERQRRIEAAAAAAAAAENQDSATTETQGGTNAEQASALGDLATGGENEEGQPQDAEHVNAPIPPIDF